MARLVLDQPTEDGTGEIYLLTNLPAKVTAAAAVELNGNRWPIERVFSELTASLWAEIETLGYWTPSSSTRKWWYRASAWATLALAPPCQIWCSACESDRAGIGSSETHEQLG
jgi:hypothetical protein